MQTNGDSGCATMFCSKIQGYFPRELIIFVAGYAYNAGRRRARAIAAQTLPRDCQCNRANVRRLTACNAKTSVISGKSTHNFDMVVVFTTGGIKANDCAHILPTV